MHAGTAVYVEVGYKQLVVREDWVIKHTVNLVEGWPYMKTFIAQCNYIYFLNLTKENSSNETIQMDQ